MQPPMLSGAAHSSVCCPVESKETTAGGEVKVIVVERLSTAEESRFFPARSGSLPVSGGCGCERGEGLSLGMASGIDELEAQFSASSKPGRCGTQSATSQGRSAGDL